MNISHLALLLFAPVLSGQVSITIQDRPAAFTLEAGSHNLFDVIDRAADFLDRNYIIEGLRRHEVGASNYFPPIPLLPFYRRRFGYGPGDFPVAESVSHRTVALPFFTRLTEREVDLVCQTLELMMTRITFART